jgi:hypothetical protein
MPRRLKSRDWQTESSDSQVEIKRLADRKQKSRDWQTESSDSQVENNRLDRKQSLADGKQETGR